MSPCASRSLMTRRPGITLLELLIAVILGVVILLGIGQVDVTRIYIGNQVRRNSVPQTEASIAATHLLKTLEQADRVFLAAPDSIQIRVPQGGPAVNLDDAASYRWVQYRYDSGSQEILYFDPVSPCTVAQRFGDCRSTPQSPACFTSLTVQYQDESSTPPGGDPSGQNLAPPEDNNMLEMTVQWTDQQTNVAQQFVSQMTMRAGAYTNLSTGLSPAGAAFDPPNPC